MHFGMKKRVGLILCLFACCILGVTTTGCGTIFGKDRSAVQFRGLRSVVGLQTKEEKICERADKDDFPSADELGM